MTLGSFPGGRRRARHSDGGFDSSSESARVIDEERLWGFLSSRLRKERCSGVEHLRPLTSVSFIYPKSWDLLGHGRKETKAGGFDMAVAVCPRSQSTERNGGSKQSQPTVSRSFPSSLESPTIG